METPQGVKRPSSSIGFLFLYPKLIATTAKTTSQDRSYLVSEPSEFEAGNPSREHGPSCA
jgi:hypothetical protein